MMTAPDMPLHPAAEATAERASAPPQGKPPSEGPSGDDLRLLQSSVEEIQAALRSCLSVCRGALGCRSMLLWWLDESGPY